MSTDLENSKQFWSSFYAEDIRSERVLPPSQFAAFVAQELEPHTAILDVGCGEGRDSIFFAEMGFQVIALDRCPDAIRLANEKSQRRQLSNLRFVVSDLNSEFLQEIISSVGNGKLCVYARFFLHAISQAEQTRFFETLSMNIGNGSLLAFEYRTEEDRFLEKSTQSHFRRYQTSEYLNRELESLNFIKRYAVEGRGFAKYKCDDAIVARCIFEKKSTADSP